MTVKAYLALLVGVFVVALLAVSLVQGNLVGDLAAVARDVTGSHAPRARAARELRAAHLVERRALAGFLLTAEPAESGPGTAGRAWSAGPTPACTRPRKPDATGSWPAPRPTREPSHRKAKMRQDTDDGKRPGKAHGKRGSGWPTSR
jgi:hypothetical protein